MNYPRYLLLGAACMACLTLGSARSSVTQATITVTTTDDELNTDGDCALREAIRAANLNHAVDRCAAGSDTDLITIPAGTYTLTRSGVDNTASSGDLDLVGTITLRGTAAQTTIIDANTIDRGFDVQPDATVTISDLTIRRGAPRYDEDDQGDSGAGIRNSGTVIMSESVVTENTWAGGIANYGTLTVIRTTMQRNGEGSIHNAGLLTVLDSLIQENAAMWGAGMTNDGVATIIGSLLTTNFADGESHGSGAAIYNTGTLTIRESDIRGNRADWGGGIFNQSGEVLIINSRISENMYSEGYGAGIYNNAIMTLERTLVTNNHGGHGGGGAGIANLGVLYINNSTISNNTAILDDNTGGASNDTGGGIYNIGTVYLTNSTISGNSAVWGGGIVNGGVVAGLPPNGAHDASSAGIVIARNSTISGNHAIDIGGGIFNSGVGDAQPSVVTLNNVTIVENTVGHGSEGDGAGGGFYSSHPSMMYSGNSLIAANTDARGDASDCVGSLHARGYTLIGNGVGCTIGGDTTGNLVGLDPRLGPLHTNGGPTATHALLPDSPAIDGGSPDAPGSGFASCEAIDQRGGMRPQDGTSDGVTRCDIGAYEVQTTPMIARQVFMPLIHQ